MPERVILCIGTRKGLFVAEALEDPANASRCAGRSDRAWRCTRR